MKKCAKMTAMLNSGRKRGWSIGLGGALLVAMTLGVAACQESQTAFYKREQNTSERSTREKSDLASPSFETGAAGQPIAGRPTEYLQEHLRVRTQPGARDPRVTVFEDGHMVMAETGGGAPHSRSSVRSSTGIRVMSGSGNLEDGDINGVERAAGFSRVQPFLGDIPLLDGRQLEGARADLDGGTLPRRETPTHLVSRLRPDEELWVIERCPIEDDDHWRAPPPPRDDDFPGCGALLCIDPARQTTVPVPLTHTAVDAEISAYIATVDVVQQYENPFASKIEAVYVFPLPENAAVSEFVMTVGDRKIRGVIREREEAEHIYYEARANGHVASLLTQERPNIFTQRVANIEPGKRIDISVTYFHTLAWSDGEYQFVFPMVVGPRFNPPGEYDGVGAIPRGLAASGASGQPVEVPYLRPTERSGHDISLSVNIDAGVPIEDVSSPTHAVAIQKTSSDSAHVTLSRRDAIPNHDFVLRYRVAGDKMKSGLITRKDGRGGFFTLMLYPPRTLDHCERGPIEMIFVLDCSGSMSGEPLRIAKDAAAEALRLLEPGDTFQIIRFSERASALGHAPIPATRRNVQHGLEYLHSLAGGGGTMMIEGIRAALDFPHDPRRLRFVCFLTDGYIGNEDEILGEMRNRLHDSRVFSFGVGSSPNRHLMSAMARMGAGAAAYLGLNDSGAEVMGLFMNRIAHAALTDISVDFGDLEVEDVYPRRVPDLFVGRPVILTGRFNGDGRADVRVSGRVGDRRHTFNVRVNSDFPDEKHKGLPAVWARQKIADLSDTARSRHLRDFERIVTDTALAFNLMSPFTSFVAVDSLSRTGGDFGVTVPVPVPVPDGARYDTTVAER